MKTLSSLLLVAFIVLAGCSADDLAGPDFTANVEALAVQAPAHADARSDVAATTSFIVGTWRASDRHGTVTLFIDEVDAPILASARATVAIEGKGVVEDVWTRPLDILIEGQYQRRDIKIALLAPDGTVLAKGEGTFSTALTHFKVVLLYESGFERPLEFSRS